MKDGNEGHGMNKKYEKFKLAVGTTFAFFILVAVMGIAFVQTVMLMKIYLKMNCWKFKEMKNFIM